MLSLINRTATSISNSTVRYIGQHVLYDFDSLENVSFDNCLSVEGLALASCTSLRKIIFPKCLQLSTQAFANCSSLVSVSLPLCVSVASLAFLSCITLSIIELPECRFVGGSAFSYCKSLATVSLPRVTIFSGQSIFANCNALKSLYLTSISTVPLLLLGTSTAYSNPFGSSCGLQTLSNAKIYVPSSLVTDFQNESGWSVFSSKYVGV